MKKINFIIIAFFAMCCWAGFVSAEEAGQKETVETSKNQEKSGLKETLPDNAKSSSEYVREAWALNAQGKLDELDMLVKEALEVYAKEAKSLQAGLENFPQTTQQEKYRVLNDVGTLLFIQAEAFMNYGQTEKAIAAFESLIKEYPWARAWDPRGWFWSIKEKSQASIDVMSGKFEEEEDEHQPQLIKTFPRLAFPGKEIVIDYRKYGEFLDVGTGKYHYKITDLKGLVEAAGEGIYPNTSWVFKDKNYRKAKKEGRLEGNHWSFVRTDDLEAAFYKWVDAPEPCGVRLFYIGMIFEKANMYYEALKAYHAIVIHFPTSVAWTNWNTPWYPAQAAIGKIKHIIRFHPELKLEPKWMRIQVKNGYDNDVENDEIMTFPGVIEKRSVLEDIKTKVPFLQKKADLGEPVKVVGQGKVQLKKYSNGHWQMFVDGEPFVIRGVTYTPTKIGQSPDKGTLVSWMYEDCNKNGLADGPFDSWVDKNRNNKQDPDEPVVGDFKLIKDMGANTIREYHQPFQPNKELLRKMHKDYGLMVILGDFLGKYTHGSGASWAEGTDYENPEHQKNMMDSVRRMVEEFKDEPYILAWVLGNENNYGVASNADQKPEAYYQFANRVAKMIKEIDPNHPVALCNGDTLYLDLFGQYAPDIDIYAANVYRGDYGFGAFWEQVRDAADKPAFITEYGSPAFISHLSLEESEKFQANYHRGNWLDIESNLAGQLNSPGNALGGVLFQWMDEWWKNYEPFYHDKKSDAIGPFPGGYYFEEWFGIIGQGNGQNSPFMRQLRKSYFAYQEMWSAFTVTEGKRQ
ncbi:MAG: glycoside hydrolase family 2 TIM barrel-domain containing protein [Candidatus Omnitrophota bacterium]